MPSLLLYLVIALFAWMGFALFGPSGDTTLTPGFLIVMACLSVIVWDRLVAPLMRRGETRQARTPGRQAQGRTLPARPVQPPAPRPGPAAPRTAPGWRPLHA